MSILAVNGFNKMHRQPSFCATRHILWADSKGVHIVNPLLLDHIKPPKGDTVEFTKVNTVTDALKAIDCRGKDRFDAVITGGRFGLDDGTTIIKNAVEKDYPKKSLIMLSAEPRRIDDFSGVAFFDKGEGLLEKLGSHLSKILSDK